MDVEVVEGRRGSLVWYSHVWYPPPGTALSYCGRRRKYTPCTAMARRGGSSCSRSCDVRECWVVGATQGVPARYMDLVVAGVGVYIEVGVPTLLASMPPISAHQRELRCVPYGACHSPRQAISDAPRYCYQRPAPPTNQRPRRLLLVIAMVPALPPLPGELAGTGQTPARHLALVGIRQGSLQHPPSSPTRRPSTGRTSPILPPFAVALASHLHRPGRAGYGTY